MKLISFIFSFIYIQIVFCQGTNTDSLSYPNQEIEVIDKQEKSTPLNPEKLAWELMLPSDYIKYEKTPEMKSFEQMFMLMKSGSAELSIVLEEIKLRTFAK